jgi:hypothetical protein
LRSGLGRNFPSLGQRQPNASAPRFRESDRDRLLRRSSAMFAFANMMHFLAYEFSGLRARRFPFSSVFSRSLDDVFFWHRSSPDHPDVALLEIETYQERIIRTLDEGKISENSCNRPREKP